MSAIVVTSPEVSPVPLVVTVPHAGRALDPSIAAMLRLPPARLHQLEDPWVHRLLDSVPANGGWLLTTGWARAVADVNRAADEFAFAAPVPGWRATGKARAGLGVVPTRLAGAPIYAAPLPPAIVEARIALAHTPWHDALAALLDRVHARFGEAFVVDGHSMPDGAQPPGLARADVVLGDCWGSAADAGWIAAIEHAFGAEGFATARNRPYAGGYITRHYGRPAAGFHVVQLELRRGLYMDEAGFAPLDGFDDVRARLGRVFDRLAAYLRVRRPPAFALAGE